ncbi:MAG: AI-2E family transporter [Chloroflexota bacterium]|nr:AI-2E family transporter [Chloroflexota bacterium]
MSENANTWTRDTKRIVVVVILIGAVLLLYLARSMLSLLALSAVLAYIFQPLVGHLEGRMPRGVAAAICVLLIVLLAALVPVLVTPWVIEGVAEILSALAQIPRLFDREVPEIAALIPDFAVGGYDVDLGDALISLERTISQAIQEASVPSIGEIVGYLVESAKAAKGLLGTAAVVLTDAMALLFGAALGAILLLMFTFYLTKDGPKLRSWLKSIAPEGAWPEWEILFFRLQIVWDSFFRGQLVLSLTVGVVTFIVALILGLPAAFVLGLLAGVLEVVPNLGPIMAAVPAVVLALIQGSTHWDINNAVFALIVIAAYVLIQQLENNLLVPRIIGTSLNLHPMIVLVGVIAGTATGGILGAFLAAPTLASVKIFFDYAHSKLNDRPPFPETTGMGEGSQVPVLAAPDASDEGAVGLEDFPEILTPGDDDQGAEEPVT